MQFAIIYILNIILEESKVACVQRGNKVWKKKDVYSRLTFIPSAKRTTPINNLISRTKVLKLFLDEFVSSRCRTNNAPVKIKEVIDNNFKENALIIPLACKSGPVKVLVIERAGERRRNKRRNILYGNDEHPRQFLVEKGNDTNDKGEIEIKRAPLINIGRSFS